MTQNHINLDFHVKCQT